MSDRTLLNIYLTSWCLYELQGFLGLTRIVAQTLLIVNVGFSLYYLVFNKYKWGAFMRILTAFIIVLTVYGVLVIISKEEIFKDFVVVDNSSYLKNIYISLLPIYPFFVFAKRGVLTEELIKHWLLVFLPVATAMFFYNRKVVLYEAMLEGVDIKDITNNVGYYFVSLLPMIVFFRKQLVIQYCLIAYCMFFLIFSMKRGAILIGAVALIIMVLKVTKNQSGYRTTRSVALLALLTILGVYIVQYFISTSDYFNYRLERTIEGDPSERDELFPLFLNHYLHETTAFQFLFGSGALSTLKVGGEYAHNDWLELAVNQGLLGIVIYLIYWITAFKEWLGSNKHEIYSLAMGLVFLIYFMKSWFSMSYDSMHVCSTLVLGYCLSKK